MKKLRDQILANGITDVHKAKKLLEYASEQYYNTGNAFLADDEFDKILTEYRKIEGAPKLKLGARSNALEVKHTSGGMLGSLSNVFSAEELYQDFITKMKKKSIIASIKYDGCSIGVDVKNNRVVKAYTRGQDGVGMDVTHIFRGFLNLGTLSSATIKAEVIMTWENFDKYCQEAKASYSNPRTAVSGIYSSKDGAMWTKYLTMVPIEFISDDISFEKRRDMIVYMNENIVKANEDITVFSMLPFKYYFIEKESSQEVYERLYQKVIRLRNTLPFMADGIVFEPNFLRVREKFGSIEKDGKSTPKWAVALKFPHKSVATKLLNVEWDVANSASGRITPCAIIKPVVIDGKEYRRVSLANAFRIVQEDFRINGRVILTIRGDVLGYVTPDDDDKSLKRVKLINECPICKSALKLTDSGAFLVCQNALCSAKLPGRICNYLAKMRVKGIEEATISKLVDAELLSSIKDLYTINLKKVAKLDGMGEKSAINIKKALQGRNEVNDWEFLGSWNWPGIGRTKMSEVCKVFNLAELIDLFNKGKIAFEDAIITRIDGFSAILARKLYSGLKSDLDEIRWIIDNNYITLLESKVNTDVKSMNFVVTGALSVDRHIVKMVLMKRGHKMSSSISRKTDYLVTNDTSSGTVKNREAKNLGIPIIDEEQFWDLIGGKP